MKKVFALILALTLALAGLTVGYSEDEGYLGQWYMSKITFDGQEMTPATFGLSMDILINADGTAIVVMGTGENKESHDATWIKDGSNILITIDGSTSTFAYDGTTLTNIDTEEMSMIFTREEAESEKYIPAAVKTGVTVEDFNGVWVSSYIEIQGIQMPTEMLGTLLTITMTDGNVVCEYMFGGESSTATTTATLENDVMTFIAGSEDSDETLDDGDSVVTLSLLEDGNLMSTFGELGIIYLEPATPEDTAE